MDYHHPPPFAMTPKTLPLTKAAVSDTVIKLRHVLRKHSLQTRNIFTSVAHSGRLLKERMLLVMTKKKMYT
jgi:hypothetical protein